MNLYMWWFFVVMVFVVLVILGLNMLFVMMYGVWYGLWCLFVMMVGCLSVLVLMFVVFVVGFGVVFEVWLVMFNGLCFVGVVYLIYFGVKVWCVCVDDMLVVDVDVVLYGVLVLCVVLFCNGFLVVGSNLKVILFVVVLLL